MRIVLKLDKYVKIGKVNSIKCNDSELTIFYDEERGATFKLNKNNGEINGYDGKLKSLEIEGFDERLPIFTMQKKVLQRIEREKILNTVVTREYSHSLVVSLLNTYEEDEFEYEIEGFRTEWWTHGRKIQMGDKILKDIINDDSNTQNSGLKLVRKLRKYI